MYFHFSCSFLSSLSEINLFTEKKQTETKQGEDFKRTRERKIRTTENLVFQLMLLYDNNMIMPRKYSDTNLTPEKIRRKSEAQFNVIVSSSCRRPRRTTFCLQQFHRE